MKINFAGKIIIAVVVLALVIGAAWFLLGKKDQSKLVNPIKTLLEKDTVQTQSGRPEARAVYACDGGKMIGAAFFKGEPKSVDPGEPPVPSGSVRLVLNDGKTMDLAQTISADGGRYANSKESFVFWDKGDSAIVQENGQEKDYANCRLQNSEWQTYTNGQFGYRIDYPVNWIFREFPGTLSGAGFRSASSTVDIATECITIDEKQTPSNENGTSFANYVKKAASVEIQGYEKLNSIEPITTDNGLQGYSTTWIHKDAEGKKKVSLPIAYFDNEKNITLDKNTEKYKTVQVILNSPECLVIYEEMIATLSLISQ
jgi:hypothetical protein